MTGPTAQLRKGGVQVSPEEIDAWQAAFSPNGWMLAVGTEVTAESGFVRPSDGRARSGDTPLEAQHETFACRHREDVLAQIV